MVRTLAVNDWRESGKIGVFIKDEWHAVLIEIEE